MAVWTIEIKTYKFDKFKWGEKGFPRYNQIRQLRLINWDKKIDNWGFQSFSYIGIKWKMNYLYKKN
jgi:hypothetical protein